MSNLAQLERHARAIRQRVVQISHDAKSAHLGGALSCVDLLVALFWETLNINPDDPENPLRDRLIFSKGHAASALYTTLAHRGFFSESRLTSFNRPGSGLPEQPAPRATPGVEWATGSLGHGLGVGLGMALAASIQGLSYSTYVLLSDGECQEGSIWEAAMLAPRLNIPPLTVLIDYNRWQATGRSAEIMQMEPFAAKWESFGWQAFEVDGHDLSEILGALRQPSTKPKAIVARTVKGKGVSFMEDDNNWHYRSPTREELEKARQELLAPSSSPSPPHS